MKKILYVLFLFILFCIGNIWGHKDKEEYLKANLQAYVTVDGKNTYALNFIPKKEEIEYQTVDLIDNRIIFEIDNKEVWEGPTPVFSLKDYKYLPFYVLPYDFLIMHLNLETSKNLTSVTQCFEGVPYLIEIPGLTEFPITP